MDSSFLPPLALSQRLAPISTADPPQDYQQALAHHQPLPVNRSTNSHGRFGLPQIKQLVEVWLAYALHGC